MILLGVAIGSRKPLPFAPELPHGTVTLRSVLVRDTSLTSLSPSTSVVLSGDGYVRWLRPFRTIEDIHVQAAFVAYVIRSARYALYDYTKNNHDGSKSKSIEEIHDLLQWLLMHLITLATLSQMDPSSYVTHLPLSQCLTVSGLHCHPLHALVNIT
jgi:hypothetical protein